MMKALAKLVAPTKSFYQELIFQATSGTSESRVFNRGENNRFVYLGHLKNFFTLSEMLRWNWINRYHRP